MIDLWISPGVCLAGDIGYLDEVLCQYRGHEAPEVLIRPHTWARIAFGLLAFPVIEGLRRVRGMRSAARAKSMFAGEG